MHMDMVGSAQKAVQPLRVSDVLVDGNDNLLGLLEEPVVTPVRVHLREPLGDTGWQFNMKSYEIKK